MNLDLLLAVLIVQYQLADKEAVLASYEEWKGSKAEAFHEFLVRRGVLQDTDRQLILPMYQALVAKNHGDADLCYSALSSIGSTFAEHREEAGVADATGSWSPSQEDGSSNVSASSEENRTSIPGKPRYRVLRPHAKGGLGEVSVATDVELNREVALKEIQDRFVRDSDSRARFLLEAEVTGKLEHPGIVPVYGLGTYPDGRPFYAMRFIQGDSLKDAIAKFHAEKEGHRTGSERRLIERQLLQRFVDVCYAIDFAHSRGVLHRDIKPGNIMLGQYGETLVVDWGLAKIMGAASPREGSQQISLSSNSNSAPTQVGSAVGTPAYMPPEQATGQLDLLGPHSDTYSLGATLFHILTGRPPFEGQNAAAIIRSVIAGDVPHPRALNPSIPKSLESICLKAMARDPKHRYPSVRDLAIDIERFLADEPVSSMKESLTARIFRWIRKHPTATAAAVSGILVAAFGLMVFSSIIGRKNQLLSFANEQLDERNQELRSSLERESDARKEAVANLKVAKDQSRLALSTLQGVVTDIQSAVRDMPGSNRIRSRLLNTSLAQLQRVASDYVSRSEVDESTWVALQELGDVVLEFGNDPNPQTNQESSDSETPTSALQLARSLSDRCLAIAKELEAKDPADELAQLRIAHTLSQRALVLERMGELREAINALKEATEFQEPSLSQATPKKRLEYLRDMIELGRLHILMGELPAAFENTNRAYDQAVAWHAENPTYESEDGLALCLERLGTLWAFELDFDKAQDVLEKALAIRDRMAQEKPDDKIRLHRMANLRDELGEVYAKLKKHSDALAQYEQGYLIREKLYREEPENEVYIRGLLGTMDRLGDANYDLRSVDLALHWYEQGRDQRRKMLERDPENVRMERELALSFEKMGMATRARGEPEEALKLLATCLAMRSELLKQNSESALALRDVMVTHLQIYNTYADQENYPKCHEHLLSAQEIVKTMIEKNMNLKRSQAEYNDMQAKLELLKEFMMQGEQKQE